MLEYWGGVAQSYGFPKNVKFEHKIDTDLYEFVRVSGWPHTQASPHTCFCKHGNKTFFFHVRGGLVTRLVSGPAGYRMSEWSH